MVVCVLIPRFELIAACSGDWRLLRGPVALAPEAGRAQVVGPASRAAEEAFGIRPGMRVGEALARCPEIKLLPPDPVRGAALWEETLKRLEEIGATIESRRPGEAFFEADGLLALHGGLERLLEATGRAAVGRRRALGAAIRIAAASGPFAARLAALHEEGDGPAPGRHKDGGGQRRRKTGRGPVPPARYIAPEETASFLAPLPITALADEPGLDPGLIEDLERLGIADLGSLAAIPAARIADRFGEPGLRAHRLAAGEPEPLHPRRPPEPLEQTLALPDSLDGSQLSHALKLLIDRFLAMPERQGRMIRSLVLSATLAAGGSWRRPVALNRPSGSAEVLHLALAPSLDLLPGPVDSLSLRALELGPTTPDQQPFDLDADRRRRARLKEAVRQARAGAGPNSLLRVLTLDPDARLPENRLTLTPFEPS